MKRLIKGHYSDGTERRYANHDNMLEYLGVKQLPKEGMPERLIDGVRVYVKPSNADYPWHTNGAGSRWRYRPHRITAICDCGVHVSVGRLHQHKCKS